MNSDIGIDVQAKNLVVTKEGIPIISIDSLSIQSGEILALIGPNGAGKTTLMKALALLEKFSSGELTIKGERVDWSHSLYSLRRRMGVVFQSPLLFDTTVWKNIAAGLKFRKMKSADQKPIIEAVCAQMGISHLVHRSARALSGGEAYRVNLARAFVLNPEILFLDEPFRALDPPTRESLLNDLEKMLHSSHTTAVFITHDCSEAVRIAHRIAVMREGKILQIGAVEDVVNSPADEFIAGFVGTETILSGKVLKVSEGAFIVAVEREEIEASGVAQAGDAVILCIRPENVMLSIEEPQRKRVSVRNIFHGVIRKIVPTGSHYRVHLECGFPLSAFVTKQSLHDLCLETGSTVIAQFKATAIHVIRKS